MLSSKQMTMARAHARVAPASFPKGRRALVVVANEKQGKGGEEGGKVSAGSPMHLIQHSQRSLLNRPSTLLLSAEV